MVQSSRNEGNDYRLYDEAALKRVRQIILLRKLQIPVKQISVILNNPNAAVVVDIFRQNITELDGEITALSTVKDILTIFVERIENIANIELNLEYLGEESVLQLAGSLSLISKNVKTGMTMGDLSKAADVLNKLRNVRVVHLPPMTAASALDTGENASDKAWRAICDFVAQSNLFAIKPDLRVFRIEHANASGRSFGSEAWVSVPDDFAIPAPLTKKGSSAAHTRRMCSGTTAF